MRGQFDAAMATLNRVYSAGRGKASEDLAVQEAENELLVMWTSVEQDRQAFLVRGGREGDGGKVRQETRRKER